MLLRFWFPLAASWMLMGLEGPAIQTAIAHGAQGIAQKVQLSAFGTVFFLEVLIEAPVIMLLATSTALARDEQAYRCLRRFAWHLALGLSALAAALAHTPLFDLVVFDLLDTAPAVAEAARPGLAIMVPWTACIGGRRFLQGLMIRQGRTRRIGVGTTVRCLASLGTAGLLALRGGCTGVELGAWALMAGVVAEVGFTAWSAREPLRELRRIQHDPGVPPLRYREVLRFHLPLAATSALSLIVQPAAIAALNRTPGSSVSVAAWPVVYALLMFFHCGSYALPETVIAQLRRGAPAGRLIGFGARVGLATALAFALFVLTPLVDLYLQDVEQLEPDLRVAVLAGLKIAAILPLLHAAQNLSRGLRVAASSTARVYGAMSVHLAVVLVGLSGAVWMEQGGVRVVLCILASAYACEVLVLWKGMTAALDRAGLRLS